MFRQTEHPMCMGIGKRTVQLVLAALMFGTSLAAVSELPTADQADAQVAYTFRDVSSIDGLTDIHARAFRLYWAFFDREPDAEGALFWANRVNECWSLERIANFFSTSDEFAATYGTLTDGEFVDLIYRNVLDRPSEPAGRAFWEGEISSGRRSRVQVMLDFAYSDEFVSTRLLPSDLLPDQPCSTTAADLPIPGSDGSVLASQALNTTIPTSVCGTIVSVANNQLINGRTGASTSPSSFGGYARARTDQDDYAYSGLVQGLLDDNEIGDVAFVLDCIDETGNFVGSHLIVQLDTGPAYTFDPRDVAVLEPTGGNVGEIQGLVALYPGLSVEWTAFGPNDPFCCPSITVFSEFELDSGTFTRTRFHVEGPDAVARQIAAAAVADNWDSVFERIEEGEFEFLQGFQSTRGGLNFAGTDPCQFSSGAFSCLVNVPDWGQIGFRLAFDRDTQSYRILDILYDI